MSQSLKKYDMPLKSSPPSLICAIYIYNDLNIDMMKYILLLLMTMTMIPDCLFSCWDDYSDEDKALLEPHLRYSTSIVPLQYSYS